jgi:Holliday junction resolvase RusA-like endonuclease
LTVIIVKGTPKSIQSSPRSLGDWKNKVVIAARCVFPAPLETNNVNVRITVYHNRLPTFDTDNVSKPIVDALKQIAYNDDKQVMDHTVRKRDLNGSYRIRGVPPELAVALAEGEDFVCIEVEVLSKEEVETLQ